MHNVQNKSRDQNRNYNFIDETKNKQRRFNQYAENVEHLNVLRALAEWTNEIISIPYSSLCQERLSETISLKKGKIIELFLLKAGSCSEQQALYISLVDVFGSSSFDDK